MKQLALLPLFLLFLSSHAQKKYELLYDKPAPNRGGDFSIVKAGGKPFDADWENHSLPIGNGYMGVTLFGRTDTDRIQLTENTLSNRGLYNIGSLTSFADIFMDFDQPVISNYVRSLDLNDAVAGVRYTSGEIQHSREYFASYPDKVLVMCFRASKPGSVSFRIRPRIPYLRDPDTSALKDGRTGKVFAHGNTITLSGNLQYYDIDYEGQIRVVPFGGSMSAVNDRNDDNGRIEVVKADSVVVLVSLATNYRLQPSVFTEPVPAKKLDGFPHPHGKVEGILGAASKKTYGELRQTHLKDHQALFSRVRLDLTDSIPDLPTDRLLANYKKGIPSRYLEELYFQYGRYLLIASSRKGALPANLQGVWTQYDVSPWTSGYWHNVNVQMNYWPVFNTNLAELFTSYVDYNEAFRPMGYRHADNYIRKIDPLQYDTISGNNGWAIGTGASPYAILGPGGHSGPGTGGFTTKLFWDQYDFTRDKDLLRKTDYPAMLSMAAFLMKCVKDTLGYYLASPSSSPEQRQNKVYYQTLGCAFDQQMIQESVGDVLKAAQVLGEKESSLLFIRQKIGRLDPVQIGLSGQIKEYREEKRYGEIGEYRHRHISQLVGLYPGTIVNSKTEAWMDAARFTLSERGHISTGWAMAHRLNAWARTKEGDSSHMLLRNILQRTTNDNLWNTHPPFQIDGNFGATAGVAEMLLQSHEGYLEPLPALPSGWADGKYSGLVARGNFVVSATWTGGSLKQLEVTSRAGGTCTIRYPDIASAIVKDQRGKPVRATKKSSDVISFPTSRGDTFTFFGIKALEKVEAPAGLSLQKGSGSSIGLKWVESKDADRYRIYAAYDSEPGYTLVGELPAGRSNHTINGMPDGHERATFKVTAVKRNGKESKGAVSMLMYDHAE